MAWVKPLVKPRAEGKFIFSLQSFKIFRIIILGWSHELTINNLMLDLGNILHRVDSLYTCTQKNSKHLRSHSRATMALDHSRLGLENKFWENKSGRICLCLTSLRYKFLSANLGVCKPTFYTFYTTDLRWNSTIYHTDLGQNAVFHNFSRQIALGNIQDDPNRGRLAKPFKKCPKSPMRPASSHF